MKLNQQIDDFTLEPSFSRLDKTAITYSKQLTLRMSDKFILDGSSVPPELLAETPIAPAPPGFTTNFIDHPSRARSVLVVTGTTVPLILIFLGLRIYVRTRINREFGIDDCKSINGKGAGGGVHHRAKDRNDIFLF